MDYGLVSVIIPTYNRFNFLKHTLESVLLQNYKNIEIIIINDGSSQTDYYEKKHEITSLSSKIIIIDLDENCKIKFNTQSAQGKAREIGIKQSNGKWIAFLDDDDYWMPDKIQIQLIKIHELNDSSCIGCCTNGFKGHGPPNINALITNSYELYHHANYCNEKISYNNILNENLIINSSVIISRELFNKVGDFEVDVPEDYDYWLRCLRLPNSPYFFYIDQPLIFYNIGHGDGIHYRHTKNVNK